MMLTTFIFHHLVTIVGKNQFRALKKS